MKIISIVGVRPQFIKLCPIQAAIQKKHQHIIIHTGQHYDFNMSAVFLEELGIGKPHYNLHIGSASHGEQTGQMLIGLEKILQTEKPDAVLVLGDTNSTLAGALAAVKLRIPLAHIEAGVRSFNRDMPEEINRLLTDRIADYLFCPVETAVNNLAKEGIVKNVFFVGDVMYDAALFFAQQAEQHTDIVNRLNITSGQYLLATVHRPSNTDDKGVLSALFKTLAEIGEPIIFPVHPRTATAIKHYQLPIGSHIKLIDPVGYLDMLHLIKHARMVLTDSGGVQKEAFFFSVPCITLRYETEWHELVSLGWNKVLGLDREKILETVKNWVKPSKRPDLFGNGKASEEIVNLLENVIGQ